jgi:hypothetical protein
MICNAIGMHYRTTCWEHPSGRYIRLQLSQLILVNIARVSGSLSDNACSRPHTRPPLSARADMATQTDSGHLEYITQTPILGNLRIR